MTTRILSNRANAEFDLLAKLFTLAVLTSVLLLTLAPQAHAAGTSKSVKNRRMRNSSFQAQPAPIPAGCNLVHCTNSVPIFYPALDMVCPAKIGMTCTYYIHLESQVRVSYLDAGLFRFLIDGQPPDPGPTDTGGLFEWLDNDP